jgi:hypothetical protein
MTDIVSDPGTETPLLQRLGVFDFARLDAAVAVRPRYLVQDLIHEASLNVLIGNSGLAARG